MHEKWEHVHDAKSTWNIAGSCLRHHSLTVSLTGALSSSSLPLPPSPRRMCRRHHISQTEATAAFGKARLSRIKQLRRMFRRPCPRHRYLFLLHLNGCVVVITFPRRKPRQHFGKARLSRVKQLCRMFRKAQQYITFQPRQSLTTTTDPNTNQHSIYLPTLSLTRLSLGGGQSRNNGPGCTAATKQQLNCDDDVVALWLCSAFDGFKQTTNIKGISITISNKYLWF